MDRQPVAPDDQQRKEDHDQRPPHQSQLFQDDGKDVVVLGLRQVAELLAALAQPHTQQTAGADGVQALDGLPRVVPTEGQVPAEGVPPHLKPGGVVVDGMEKLVDDLRKVQQVAHQAQRPAARGHPAPVDAPHHHHGRPDAQDQERTGKMWLDQRQNRHHHQKDDVGQKPLLEGLHLLPLLGDGLGEVDDQAQLRHLRGLEGEGGARKAQPAGGPVFAQGQQASILVRSRDNHQNQQEDGPGEGQPGQPAEALVVDLGHPPHDKHAQSGEGRLPLEIVQRVVFQIGAGLGRGEAGGEEHDEPHRQQHHRQQQEGQVHGTPGGLPRLLASAPVLALLLFFQLPIFVPGEGDAVPGLDGTGFLWGHVRGLLSRKREMACGEPATAS